MALIESRYASSTLKDLGNGGYPRMTHGDVSSKVSASVPGPTPQGRWHPRLRHA